MKILVGSKIQDIEGAVAPFVLADVDAATSIYNAVIATGARLSVGSWTPEAEADARGDGKAGPEFLSVHVWHVTPEQGVQILALGLEGTQQNGYSLLIQKHDWWPRDRYEQMSETEQIAADRAWVDAGGWLGKEKLRRAGIV